MNPTGMWACVETRPNGTQVVHRVAGREACDQLAGVLRACGFDAVVRPAVLAEGGGP